jgi:hypothetical protein
LWQGGELYFNPELDQGFGIGSTMGLAGFPNGEAQKAGSVAIQTCGIKCIFDRANSVE